MGDDAVRNACPTGMQLDYGEEDFPHLSPYPAIPKKTMSRNFLEVVPNQGGNHCLYFSIAGLYKETIEMPHGSSLKQRMNDMAKTFMPHKPGPFETDPLYLRSMFVNFLFVHFDHYFKQQAFQDTLVDIAKKTERNLTKTSPRLEISMAYRKQMLKKRMDDPSKPLEFAGMVELDIASELFGMKIALWVVPDADPSKCLRMNVFLPEILCNTVEKDMWIYRWNVLNTGHVHFEHIKMWIQPLDKDLLENNVCSGKPPEPAEPPPQPPPPPTKKENKKKHVHWDPALEDLAPGAKAKIEALAAGNPNYTFDRFKDWVVKSFPDLVKATNVFVVYAFYAAYLEYANAPDPPWWKQTAINLTNYFFGTPNATRDGSVVDAVFAKAEARKLTTAQ